MKSSKRKIIVLENAVTVTGSLYSILRSSIGLKDIYDFEVILPKGSTALALVRNYGFEARELPMKEIRKNGWALFTYIPRLLLNAFRLSRIVKHEDAALLVNNDFYNLLPTILVMFGGRVPYVCYVRFMPSKFPKPLVRLWYGLHSRYAKKVIAVSNAVKTELHDPDVTVVYNELPEGNVPVTLAVSHLILYPANYIHGKGQEHALNAFHRISKTHPTWKLRFVGGDMGLAKNRAFKDSLIRQCQEWSLSGVVEFLDFSPTLSDHYREAAIVLNFSESESFSLTTLEAQFYGRPVVATRCGGPEEIVVDHQTGILVPVNDIDAMTKAMDELLSNATLRQNMGAEGYEHVREKFAHENTVEKLAEIYRSAIEK